MHDADASSSFTRLPVEILAIISEVNDGTRTRLDAEEYRGRLMGERTVFANGNTLGDSHVHLTWVQRETDCLNGRLGIQYVVGI